MGAEAAHQLATEAAFLDASIDPALTSHVSTTAEGSEHIQDIVAREESLRCPAISDSTHAQHMHAHGKAAETVDFPDGQAPAEHMPRTSNPKRTSDPPVVTPEIVKNNQTKSPVLKEATLVLHSPNTRISSQSIGSRAPVGEQAYATDMPKISNISDEAEAIISSRQAPAALVPSTSNPGDAASPDAPGNGAPAAHMPSTSTPGDAASPDAPGNGAPAAHMPSTSTPGDAASPDAPGNGVPAAHVQDIDMNDEAFLEAGSSVEHMPNNPLFKSNPVSNGTSVLMLSICFANVFVIFR